ncbi:LysE family translocator [Corynebacterium uterequi]|uniref:Putative threonine efflux protein n=1 Tax=Corynebacterium uterequi TaxID=1072256 RepID=A0A0G3HDA3_9CORY|nr:LysE family translocator [Corynebacterium uterequi]AKK10665.1 putative threonine efflux protein [Corynebacterium uterequi]
MDASSYLTLLGVWVAAIASPGPDVVQVLRTSLKSQRAGVACAAGIMTGNAGWALLSLLGVGAILTASPGWFGALQIAGGAYIAYLGFSSLRSGVRNVRSPSSQQGLPEETAPPRNLSLAQGYRAGVSTNLANPKAVLFFTAVFSQFVQPGLGAWWIGVIFGTVLVVGLAWFCSIALAIGRIAPVMHRYAGHIDLATGVVFAALGAWMIVHGVTTAVG